MSGKSETSHFGNPQTSLKGANKFHIFSFHPEKGNGNWVASSLFHHAGMEMGQGWTKTLKFPAILTVASSCLGICLVGVDPNWCLQFPQKCFDVYVVYLVFLWENSACSFLVCRLADVTALFHHFSVSHSQVCFLGSSNSVSHPWLHNSFKKNPNVQTTPQTNSVRIYRGWMWSSGLFSFLRPFFLRWWNKDR